jgi:hypothetical protein
MTQPTTTARDAATGEPGPRWWVCLFGFALALRVFSLFDAWSPHQGDFHGLFGAFATGGPVTTLVDRGLFESGGMPVEWRIDLADGTTETRFYMHHPPAFMLLSAIVLDVLGTSAASMRILPLVFSLFSIFATYRLARQVGGESVARVAALLMTVVPFSSRDGMQTWTEGAIAGTTALLVASALRFVDDGRRRDLVLASFWLVVGALLDWPAHFVLPGLAIWGFVRCRRAGDFSRFRRALVLPALSALVLVGHRVHMELVAGRDVAHQDTHGALSFVTKWPEGLDAKLQFFWVQYAYQVEGFTRPVLALFLVGLLAASLRIVPVRAAAIWLALPPGLMYVLMFPGRSVNHDFFMLVSAPAVCLGAAAGVAALGAPLLRRARRVGPVVVDLVLVLVSLNAVWSMLVQWQHHRSEEMRWLVRQEWLAPVIADERAVVITHLGRGALLPFFSKAPVVYGTGNLGELEDHLARIVARIEPQRRAIFLFDVALGGQDPNLVPVVERLNGLATPVVHTVDIGRGPETFVVWDLPTGRAL